MIFRSIASKFTLGAQVVCVTHIKHADKIECLNVFPKAWLDWTVVGTFCIDKGTESEKKGRKGRGRQRSTIVKKSKDGSSLPSSWFLGIPNRDDGLVWTELPGDYLLIQIQNSVNIGNVAQIFFGGFYICWDYAISFSQHFPMKNFSPSPPTSPSPLSHWNSEYWLKLGKIFF